MTIEAEIREQIIDRSRISWIIKNMPVTFMDDRFEILDCFDGLPGRLPKLYRKKIDVLLEKR